MQTERNFFEELKYQFNFGGGTIKLLMVNVSVFLIAIIFFTIGNAIGGDGGNFLTRLFELIFTVNSKDFWWQPWTLFTSVFTHINAIHLLFNMLFLYFAGKAFEQLFDQKRLIYTYIFGGFFGILIQLVGMYTFPVFLGNSDEIIGASGAVMALFAAIAFHRPSMKVSFFGAFEFQIIWLALAFIVYDFIQIGIYDGTSHLVHLGGAIFGMWSISNITSSSNIINVIMRFFDSIIQFFRKLIAPQSRMRVKKGGQNTARFQTDEEYNEDAVARQKKIDLILEKIAKSGYESLTKTEKEYLFKQSKK